MCVGPPIWQGSVCDLSRLLCQERYAGNASLFSILSSGKAGAHTFLVNSDRAHHRPPLPPPLLLTTLPPTALFQTEYAHFFLPTLQFSLSLSFSPHSLIFTVSPNRFNTLPEVSCTLLICAPFDFVFLLPLPSSESVFVFERSRK